MDRLQRLLHQAHVDFQRANGAADTDKRKKSIKFQEPVSETWIRQHRTWHPNGYYKLFCAHDKPYWEVCSSPTCRRDAKEAHTQRKKLLGF